MEGQSDDGGERRRDRQRRMRGEGERVERRKVRGGTKRTLKCNVNLNTVLFCYVNYLQHAIYHLYINESIFLIKVLT